MNMNDCRLQNAAHADQERAFPDREMRHADRKSHFLIRKCPMLTGKTIS